jgi:hypothetical protein
MSLLKNIFSVYNKDLHKVVCILGFKIKFRNLKKEIDLLKKELEKKFENKIQELSKNERFNNIFIR